MPPKPSQAIPPTTTAVQMGMMYGEYSGAHGVTLGFAAARNHVMHFVAGPPSHTEHFIGMGKWFLALVCIGILVLLVLLVASMM